MKWFEWLWSLKEERNFNFFRNYYIMIENAMKKILTKKIDQLIQIKNKKN